MAVDLLTALFLVLLGLITGIIASVAGIGGGVLFVPIFNLLLGIDIKKSIGTSLFTIFFLSLSSGSSYLRKHVVDVRTGLTFELASTPGAIVGAYLTTVLPAVILKLIFSFVLIYSGFKMFRKKDRRQDLGSSIIYGESHFTNHFTRFNIKRRIITKDGITYEYTYNLLFGIILSFFAGLASGMLGIGGGTIKVPAMNLVLGIPIHVAVATSSFMIIFTTLSGIFAHIFLGNILYEIAVFTIIGAIIGAQIGPRISTRIEKNVLRKIVGIILIIAALRMLFSVLL